MTFRLLAYASLLLVVLSACGGEPENNTVLDRRFLTSEQGEAQIVNLRAGVGGEVLDDYEWEDGEQSVYTLLSREHDATTGETGIFLRHYFLAAPGPTLRWTYRDTVTCLHRGAAAGAVNVKNQSPDLRLETVTDGTTRQFLLRYTLQCSFENDQAFARNLVVINANSGTPEVRLQGDKEGLYDAYDLVNLPEDTVQRLLALWEE